MPVVFRRWADPLPGKKDIEWKSGTVQFCGKLKQVPQLKQFLGGFKVGMIMQVLCSYQGGLIGGGNGNPLQKSCLENPRDGGSLVGCCLWGHTELDMTEATQQQQQGGLSTETTLTSTVKVLMPNLVQNKQWMLQMVLKSPCTRL